MFYLHFKISVTNISEYKKILRFTVIKKRYISKDIYLQQGCYDL